MSTILITGGAGFIGTNFVRLLARETDLRLVVLDSLTYAGNLGNIAELVDAGRVEFVRGDICDGPLLRDVFREYAIGRVVHLAAESHVDRSILGPGDFLRTNIDGTYQLLDVACSTWDGDFGDRRFVHVSTDEVYGTLGADDPPFVEDTPYRPNSPYSASKAASDHLVRAWSQTYGLPTVITNCSNNYGPWQFPEKLIPLMILNAVEGRPLPVYGDGRQVRDWLHVEDHCRGIWAALTRGRPGEVYVFGGESERANVDIVHLVCRSLDTLLGRAAGSSADLIEHVSDRPGHDRRYAINPEKARRTLGWKRRHTLENSLADVVRWYVEHPDWAASIRSGEYRDYYERQYGGRLQGTVERRADDLTA